MGNLSKDIIEEVRKHGAGVEEEVVDYVVVGVQGAKVPRKFVKSSDTSKWQCNECGFMNEDEWDKKIHLNFYRIPKTDICLCEGCYIKPFLKDRYLENDEYIARGYESERFYQEHGRV